MPTFFCISLLFRGAVAGAEALGEFLHATFGVQETLLTRPVWVNAAPDINVDFGLDAKGFHHNFAVVDDFAGNHFGV
jgi:hypothetical protein